MTRRQFISDSTPLIALARIGELNLVRQTLGEVLIPEAVYGEIVEVAEADAVLDSTACQVAELLAGVVAGVLDEE